MFVYFGQVYVGSYEITAIAESPEKCRAALISKYRKCFGSFRGNGFKNTADWLEFHGIDEDGCFEKIALNSAVCR